MFSKYFITTSVTMLPFLTMSMNNLMLIWLMLELSNFLYITLLSFYLWTKKMVLFDFLTQMTSSIFLIMAIINSPLSSMNNPMSLMMILLGLSIKLSIPPFHLWMVQMSPYMPWILLLLMMTIQKMLPLYILSICPMNNLLMLSSMMLCEIVPPLMMFNLMNLKKLLSYSSNNQMGWMLPLILMKNIFSLMYSIMYTIIMVLMTFLLMFYKVSTNYLNKPYQINTPLQILTLTLAGALPFNLFLFKWFSMYLIIMNSNNLTFILILMMLSSFIMFYMYLKMMYLTTYINLSTPKMINYNNQSPLSYLKTTLLFLAMLLTPLIMMM